MRSYSTFQEFWPFYLSQHRDPRNRRLHFLGSTLALGLIAVIAFSGRWSWLPLCFLAGYGPAWIGHFVVERNRPATFTYPVYSLRADFRMYFLALTGGLRAELERAAAIYNAGSSPRSVPPR